MTTATDLLTLSREELYQLVWSKPMVEPAKDFHLSDVALARSPLGTNDDTLFGSRVIEADRGCQFSVRKKR